ncbi:serine hydrolase [Sphingobacterium sp. BIGb0165]|uniref:serine hydrolase domain-containing protein n=1 Tax=Sphingobacterium sp. BIGb0165 TaxID=2940615 RepID=UPI0021697157|nr:serine hydrolase [Sphingobacterium sp. BIGb0165]MCS4227847.1 CubicO group peptidase (beta-lactamase class C family) [Sphingobacterium sp. BIGb0165]
MKKGFFGVLFAGLFCIGPLFAQYKSTIKNETILYNNVDQLLPLGNLAQLRIAVVVPHAEKYAAFTNQLARYAGITLFDFSKFDEEIKYYNTIIVAGKEDDLDADCLAQLKQAVLNNKKVVLCHFFEQERNKKSLSEHPQSDLIELLAPFTELGQRNAAMSIFGGAAIAAGNIKTAQSRLQYSSGENSNLNLGKLTKKIDAIAQEAIEKQATPGAVVMIIKDGQVLLEKSYGYHTYSKDIPTKTSDIFDLASVSKIAGTTPVIMRLTERNIINLDSTMGHYLWQAKYTNKKDIKLRSVMLHEAGFTPFIPFYKYLKAGDVVAVPDQQHQVKMADNSYILNHYYRDLMWPEMLKSPVKPTGNYVYSDISMYVMKEVAEHQTAEPLQDYVQENFYKPLGMTHAGYLPRERFAKEQIVPTEQDTSFRKTLLEGYVHDQGAAMAGGIAGHAGLFATANDLAIYGQLLLNRGEYGGERYFKSETIDLFTSKQSATSRRGLGFDRWDPNPKNEYPSKLANSTVFGHTGYTGTCIWVDPQNQLIYIFLSNRVHPQVSTKLLDLNIRSRIQDAIYEAINEVKK